MLEDVDEVMETMQIEQEPPIDDEIQLSRHLMNSSENATKFKRFEALYNTALNINDQLLCSNVQTEAG